jgi:DNA (cytosine-5)-methyltransferase 1
VRLLDLYCGAGGSATGYMRAGFTVVGVDIAPQPRYPFNFLRGSALALERWLELAGPFEAIHASPPCQRWAEGGEWHEREHYPDLIGPTRELLEQAGLPYVIENVPAAPLRADLLLCGTMFGLRADGFEVRRHRIFELGGWSPAGRPPPCRHELPALPVFGHNPPRDFYRRYRQGVSTGTKRRALGIGWTNREELREAIPPAFTHWIGAQLREALREAA